MPGKPSRGLADVVAASAAPGDIDGQAGRLFCRGHDISPLGYTGESGLTRISLDAR